jgi:C1A family cysteine protease
VEYIVENGIYPTAAWPNTSRDSDNKTAAGDITAKGYQVTEFYDLEDNNFDQLATALLLGFPCALGLDWWGHLVCATDLVMIDSRSFGTRIRNSWGESWGERGWGVLTEKRSIGSAVAPRVVDHTV